MTTKVVLDEHDTPFCKVKGVAPDALRGGGVLPGHVRLDFGPLHCLLAGETASELGRQLLNAAMVANGASIAA